MSKMFTQTMNLILPSIWKRNSIISDTNHWIVVYKLAGQSVEALIQPFKEVNVKFFPIYRLDTDISGPILFAKTIEVRDFLKNLYGSDGFTFTFSTWGMVHKPCPSEWTCDLSIAWDEKKKRSYPSLKKGKKAKTTFKLIQTLGTYHLFECHTHYLRTQQIQTHAHFSYFDILGDTLWTNNDHLIFLEQLKPNVKNPSFKPISEGLHLALNEIIFKFHGELVKLEAPLPHSFNVLNKILARYLQPA